MTQVFGETSGSHNDLDDIQGGAVDDYQHLTISELGDVQDVGPHLSTAGTPAHANLSNVTNDTQIKSSDFPSISVDGEILLTSGVSGKSVKRSGITGMLKSVLGVLQQAVAGTDYLTPTGDGSGLTGIVTSDTIINKTSAYTFVAADFTGRTEFTNSGASAQVNFIAPVAVASYKTALRVVEPYNVNFIPEVTDSVFMGGTTLSPYTTGTISVSNGSPTVTGSGTSWLANVRAGDSFRGNGGGLYIIQSVDSNTQITLTSNHSGALSGVTYGIGKSVACKVVGFKFIIESYAANKWVIRGVGVQPAWKIYRATDQSITNNEYTKVINNTEAEDNNNNFDNVTDYRGTPTVPGRYRITFRGRIEKTSAGAFGWIYWLIYINGGSYIEVDYYDDTATHSTFFSNTVITEYPCIGTTYVEAYVYATWSTGSATLKGGLAYNEFFATRISD